MFSQLFIVFMSLFLVITGIMDADLWLLIPGCITLGSSAFCLYQCATGKPNPLDRLAEARKTPQE